MEIGDNDFGQDKIYLQCSECTEKRSTLQELIAHISYDHLRQFAYNCAACNIPCVSIEKIQQHYFEYHPILVPEYKRTVDLEVALHNLLFSSFVCDEYDDLGMEFTDNCGYTEEVEYFSEGHSIPSDDLQQVYVQENFPNLETAPMYVISTEAPIGPVETYSEFEGESPPTLQIESAPYSELAAPIDLISPYPVGCEKNLTAKPSNDVILECEYCGKKFKHCSKYFEHRASHLGQKLYPCDYCDRKFATANSARVHARSHTGEMPYVCKWKCGKRFKSSSAAKLHERSHTGERNYTCSICHFSFSRRFHLMRHLKTVHQQDEPYTKEDEGDKNLQKVVDELVDSIHDDAQRQNVVVQAIPYPEYQYQSPYQMTS